MAIVAGVSAGCGKVDPCGNEVISRTSSPSGEQQVIVFQRDCGATTGFSTQVSVLPSTEIFLERPTVWAATDSGNVLVIDSDRGAAPAGPGGGPAVAVKWRDDHTLLLAYHPRARAASAANEVGQVRVVHERRLDVR